MEAFIPKATTTMYYYVVLTHLLMYSMTKEIQPCGAYASPQEPALTREVWWVEEWSLARSSFPGMGSEMSWKFSRVTDTWSTNITM